MSALIQYHLFYTGLPRLVSTNALRKGTDIFFVCFERLYIFKLLFMVLLAHHF
jgi:hypothetical protein